jgi:hypothetical protein
MTRHKYVTFYAIPSSDGDSKIPEHYGTDDPYVSYVDRDSNHIVYPHETVNIPWWAADGDGYEGYKYYLNYYNRTYSDDIEFLKEDRDRAYNMWLKGHLYDFHERMSEAYDCEFDVRPDASSLTAPF